MKKVLICALAALFLMASCLTAFATTTYTTTTAYDAAGVKVTVNATADVAGEMITFLAHTGANPTDSTIAAIDQKTAANAGDTVTFEYTTTKDALNSIALKSGSTGNANAQVYDAVADYAWRTINVTVDGVNAGSFTLPSVVAADTEITTDFASSAVVPVGRVFATATIDGADVAEALNYSGANLKVTDDAVFANAATLAITTTAAEADATVDSVNYAKSFKTTGEEQDAREVLSVYGKVTTGVANDVTEESKSYGVILTTNATVAADAAAFVIDGSDVATFAAYGKNAAGEFAIQLINRGDSDELTNATYYGRIFVKDTSGLYAYGDTFTVTVK